MTWNQCRKLLALKLITAVVGGIVFMQYDVPYASIAPLLHLDDAPCDRLMAEDAPAELHRQWAAVKWDSRAALVYDNYTCDDYRTLGGFNRVDSAAPPLAFVIMAYKDVAHVVNLVRMLYTAGDTFCIHVDAKSRALVEQVRTFVDCFPNVIMASRLEVVYWASYGILRANLNCMHDLVASGRPWHYVVSVSAQDVPLQPIATLRRTVRAWGGRNDVEVLADEGHARRYMFHHETVVNRFGNADGNRRTSVRKTPPPHNLTVYKNNVATTLTRTLVQWALRDHVANALLEWLRDTDMPDEHFWATLIGNPDVLPAHGDAPAFQTRNASHYVTRYAQWRRAGVDCHGKYIRDVCVFGVGDLPRLRRLAAEHMFANKLHMDYQPAAYRCLLRVHGIR